jgi:hypothetical protein
MHGFIGRIWQTADHEDPVRRYFSKLLTQVYEC